MASEFTLVLHGQAGSAVQCCALHSVACSTTTIGSLIYGIHATIMPLWGVQVTCEHVRHNKSGIAHRGNNQVESLTRTPTPD